MKRVVFLFGRFLSRKQRFLLSLFFSVTKQVAFLFRRFLSKKQYFFDEQALRLKQNPGGALITTGVLISVVPTPNHLKMLTTKLDL